MGSEMCIRDRSGRMVFDRVAAPNLMHLDRVHRQDADNPILDLAHALADPQLSFEDFERMIEDKARADDRVIWGQRVEVDLMARSPVLVWRNVTRIRLINAFRRVHDAPEDALLPGEPLICDGIELPLKHRKKRLDLEARGLIKGAQVVYLGPGSKPGFSRLHVMGAESPQVSAALSARTSSTATVAPARASQRATSRPMPAPAPVTRALEPVRSISMLTGPVPSTFQGLQDPVHGRCAPLGHRVLVGAAQRVWNGHDPGVG